MNVCWEKLYFAFQFNARFLKSGQLLMKSFALALLLSMCIGHQGYVKFQVLLGPSICNICAQSFLKDDVAKHFFIFTRPYAAEGTADLDWIVGAGYGTVRRVHLGVSQRLSSRLRR